MWQKKLLLPDHVVNSTFLQIQGGEINSDGASLLAIKVVELMAKQATGKRYSSTDKFLANYFFIKLDLN